MGGGSPKKNEGHNLVDFDNESLPIKLLTGEPEWEKSDRINWLVQKVNNLSLGVAVVLTRETQYAKPRSQKKVKNFLSLTCLAELWIFKQESQQSIFPWHHYASIFD